MRWQCADYVMSAIATILLPFGRLSPLKPGPQNAKDLSAPNAPPKDNAKIPASNVLSFTPGTAGSGSMTKVNGCKYWRFLDFNKQVPCLLLCPATLSFHEARDVS